MAQKFTGIAGFRKRLGAIYKAYLFGYSLLAVTGIPLGSLSFRKNNI